MLTDLGWLRQVKLEDVAGNPINPATVEKLEELRSQLQAINENTDTLELKAEQVNLNTDTLEAKVQSVRDQLDVLLSSRATEATLAEVKSNVIDVETELIALNAQMDVALSTRASEDTLSDVDLKAGEIRDTIGQESGATVLSRLLDIWNLITSLIGNGLGKLKLWDGTRVVSIDNANRLYVNVGAVTPPATTPVIRIEHSSITGTVDDVYVIPTGETVSLTRLSGGSEYDSVAGSEIEILYDPNGDGSVLVEIEAIYVNGSSIQFQLSGSYLGDGTNAIRLRRKRLGGGSKEVYARWEGYY